MSVFPAVLNSMRNSLSVNNRRILGQLPLFSTIQRNFTTSMSILHKNRRPDLSRPELWYEDYPISLIGQRQSPINIITEDCVLNNRDLVLKKLEIEYPPLFNGLILKNPRDIFYGWRVDVPFNEADKTLLRGGPLEHNYRLAQFHCHWGKNCSCGSEHTIDGNYYAAELHFVHWNTDLFLTPRDALYSQNGLSVIAVFLQICDKPNEELSKLSSLMSSVRYKGEKITIKESMNLSKLLPQQKAYWTYLGSLTTPPLWESVTWIVFKEPVYCTEQQIESFRQISYFPYSEDLMSGSNDCDINVEENYRPPQPLNNRKIIYVNGKS
jgi:carbonic anhydrase